jgi:transposase
MIFGKHESQISRWVKNYMEEERVGRPPAKHNRKVKPEHVQWIMDVLLENPLLFLDEIQKELKDKHDLQVSQSTIWRTIRELGFTRKVVERRAIQVSQVSIY